MTALSIAAEKARALAAEKRLRGNTYNILDYGAVDGADCTAAFVAANAAAGPAGVIYVPGKPGGTNYKVTSLVTMGIRVGIVGDGPDSSIITTSAGGGFTWIGSGAPETAWPRFVHLHGFRINHTGSIAPLHMELSNNGFASHVWVFGASTATASGNGWELYDSYQWTLVNCRSYTFGQSGFALHSSGVTQPGQFVFIGCDSGFHTAFCWDYNSASNVMDGVIHLACICLGSSGTTRGVSMVGGGGIRNFSLIDCHYQNDTNANTMTGVYQSGADCVNLRVDGGLWSKVQKPIDLTGTVHGCDIGRLNLVVNSVTSPSNYVINTTSSVEGLSLGWVRNASAGAYAHIYDGNASSVANPWAWDGVISTTPVDGGVP